MPIDVRMPDGTLITDVPDNITQADLLARYNAFSAQPATPVAPAIEVTPPAPQVGPEGAPIPSVLQTQPQVSEDRPAAGSARKGIVNLKQTVENLKLSNLMELQDAYKKQYGQDYENAPPEKLPDLQKLEDDINTSRRISTSYDLERQTLSKKFGITPLAKKLDEVQSTPEYDKANTLQKFQAIGETLLKNPGDIPSYIGNIGLESLPNSMAMMASAVLARFMTGSPTSAAAAGGASSSFMEFGNQYVNARDQGKTHEDAMAEASVKSGVIGYFDAVSFNSAGKALEEIVKDFKKGAIKATAKEVGKETGKQAGYGAAGEAVGSVITGQPVDPRAVVEEALGEIAGAPMEAVTTYKSTKEAAEAPKTPPVSERIEPEVTPIREVPAPVPVAEPAPVSQAAPTSHDTQAMIDELSGKDIEFVPEEDKVTETKPRETIKEFIDRATPEELEEFRRKNAALDMSDEGRRLRAEREAAEALAKTRKEPAQEIIQTTPMGNNTEYHVLQNDQGYVANLYDKDAGQYVSGSLRMFPSETFGEQTELAVKNFVQEEQNKAAQYDPSIKEEPTGVITEEERQFTPVGGRLINKADAAKLARESAIALQQNLATQEAEKEKQLKQEAREEKFREPPTQTLSARLVQEGGISREQKRDMLGETGKVETYDHVFRLKGNDLRTLIKDGKLDDYLPPELRTSATPYEKLYDAEPAYNYISDMIKTGEKVRTYDYEMAKLQHENMVYEKNLAKQQMTPNEAARAARVEAMDLGPMYEKIKAKPGANVGRIAKMLGPQLYGSMENISEVSVKEMIQNSFDAIKTMLEKGIMDNGNISIDMDPNNRSITIKDDGSGMSPDVLQNTFFTIAGTNKETEFGSGGFGIAKMLFLFGNQSVEVTTLRDGQISSFVATGEQLKASLDDPSQAPDIETYTIDQYNQKELKEDFPQGHGTIVTVVVPETFTDPSTGKTEDIPFVADKYEYPVLRYSPLFANINVKFNNENLMLGSSFPKEDYTTFVNADFDWGTARIYVSTIERDKYGKNLHILSNGLWQFSEDLTKKPGDRYADNIPHRFYIDIVSRVKPEEQGYPFTFNRQSLTKEAGADLDLIKNYLWLNYTKKDLANTSTSFGNVHYLTKKNGKINVSAKEDLNPEVNVQDISDGIQEGSNVKVIDGKLIVNGKEIPALNLQDLKNATIDLDELKIPQENVKSNDIMIHDNLNVEYEYDKFKPITELAKEKFGDRFDKFMYDIGDVFRALRDRVVYLNIKGELPNYEDVSYKDLANNAIGISFDKEYRGVSIKLPFEGMFINPAFPEFIDTPERAGFGLFGTMIHELAHYQVRNHESEFPAEMQRLSIVLESDPDLNLNGLKQSLINSIRKNKDILDYLNDLGVNYESQSIGQRFKDSEYERTTGRTPQNIPESRRAGQPRRELPSNVRPGDQIARQMQQYQSIPSASQATQGRQIGRPPRSFRGQEVLPQWHGPEESKIDEWIYRLQNKQIDTKRVQELIGDIEEDWNVYEKEQLYHGRTAAGIRNFLLKELLPVIKEIERLKISPEDVRTYLHNRHAEERNIQMNKINPDIYDETTGRTIPNPLKDKGSGISTADARAYLAGLDPARKQILEQIANKFDQMVKGTQQILINSGAESADTIAKWNSTYEHYVPLFRVEDEMARPTGMGGTGQGFGVRGAFSKRAMGSEKDVQDILSNIIAQRERALIRAEKIRVGRALYGLAIQNPNPDFWLPINPDAIRNKKQAIAELRRMGIPDAEDVVNNLMAEPKERYLKKIKVAEGVEPEEDFDFDSGLPVNQSKEVVASKVNVMARYKNYVFPVRINGKDRYIFFNKNDPRAFRMVQSLKNLDVEQLGYLESLFGKFTRWFKNVNTQYNPVFGLVNFLRDMSGTFLNLTNTEIKGKQAQVIAGAYKAMGGILNVHRAERKGKPLPTGPWAKLYQEARDEGFQTGYRDSLIRNQEEMQIVEHTLAQFKDGNTKKAFYAVLGALTDYNDMMENAFRLSAYKVARDQGLSKQKAAIIAKNLTVNFDKKGAWTSQVNALYAFFNASVQGTERIYQTLKGPKGKLIIGGGILAGMVQAVMLAAAGYGDDDPPEFVRERNFIVPLADGTYMTVPYPLGYNLLPNSGRIIMDFIIRGGRDAGKHMTSLMSSIMNSLNPLGSSGFALQTMMPTAIDPVVAIAENKDSFGRPIYRPDRATAPTPGYTRSRDTASTLGKGIAEFLNWASGGTKYQKGSISPTGDEVDFLAGQIGGGLYREISKAVKAIGAQSTGEALAPYQRPLVSRFYGETGSPAAVSQTFYNNVTRMTDHENEIKGRMKNREDVESYLNEHPEARLWKRANTVENKINELNKRKRMFIDRGYPRERIQAVDAQKTMLMQRFNDQVSNLTPE